jgi:type II secretory ATPase GspE/PulE/Tfp pilus assembly ATPase PilB-like protein
VRLIKAQIELSGNAADNIPATLYRGRGCKVCGNSGFQGQIGIYELFRITDAIRELILREATVGEVRKKAVADGMTTMFEDGLDKVQRGVTTIEEILRVVKE